MFTKRHLYSSVISRTTAVNKNSPLLPRSTTPDRLVSREKSKRIDFLRFFTLLVFSQGGGNRTEFLRRTTKFFLRITVTKNLIRLQFQRTSVLNEMYQ